MRKGAVWGAALALLLAAGAVWTLPSTGGGSGGERDAASDATGSVPPRPLTLVPVTPEARPPVPAAPEAEAREAATGAAQAETGKAEASPPQALDLTFYDVLKNRRVQAPREGMPQAQDHEAAAAPATPAPPPAREKPPIRVAAARVVSGISVQPLPPEDPPGRYYLDLAPVVRFGEAAAVTSRLQRDGAPAGVVAEMVGARQLFRVRLGPFTTRGEAEAAQARWTVSRQQPRVIREP